MVIRGKNHYVNIAKSNESRLIICVSLADWWISIAVHRYGSHHVRHVDSGVYFNETRRGQPEQSEK